MKPPAPVRTHHDEWVKRALSLWLEGLGDVQIDARIAGESRRGDVLYTERRASPARRKKLGVLGELARGKVLFEPFRNAPTAFELRSCVLKAIELEAREVRAARRAKQPLSTVLRTTLCVIVPSMSKEYAAEAGAVPRPAGEPGLYTLAAIWSTVIVVANELPEDSSTVWLRLLGRGAVQRGAVDELGTMSRRDGLHDATVELLLAWHQSLPPGMQLSDDDRELTMNLERIYERWERKTLARGRREGVAKGVAKGMAEGEAKGQREAMAKAVLVVVEGRGLAVTAAQRDQVLACTDIAQLDAWIHAAGTTPSMKALLSAPEATPAAKLAGRARGRRG